jgi:hypothetical protein
MQYVHIGVQLLCIWNAYLQPLFSIVALSITQQPNEYAPAYNDTNFVITESSGGIYTKDNFKFIAEVKQSTTSLAKLKAPIYYGSVNKGVFNIGRILENYVSFDWNFNDSAASGCTNSIMDYSVEFGYEYSASATGSVTEYTNLTSATGSVWNAALNPIDLVNYAGQYTMDGDGLFLTPIRSKTIHRTQKDWLYAIRNTATTALVTYSDASTQTINLPSTKVVRIPSGSQLTIPGAATYYDIQLKLGGTVLSETYRVNLIDECSKYDTTDLFFLNSLGGFDSFRFNRVRRDNYDIQRKQFKSNPYTLGATYGYTTSAFKQKTYDTNMTHKVKMFSNWITEAESEWLLDLFTSPVVYAYDGTLVAVNIDATTYEVKKHIQDNAFFIELDMSYSFESKRQRQ